MRMATKNKTKQNKNQHITNVGENMNKLELFFTVSGKVKWCNHYGKLYINM